MSRITTSFEAHKAVAKPETFLTVVLGIVLAGCSADSPGLSEIYAFGLKSKNDISNGTREPDLELRVGYFGYCIFGNRERICGRGPSIHMLNQELDDSLRLLEYARVFKGNVLFPYLL